MNTVIKVENLSKQYRLGNVGTGTISHDLNRMWHRARGKEDPYLKIGDENDRTQKGSSEYVWALKDINFEVKQGDVLGIVGKNGAGKSTLLKILSRTTTPTTGNIKIKGKVASLLEVGTGFHPELTGRENIFLNGAILGMHKREIKSKFDEIVDFSGVERYIDTPVKRYSSGMYVRLAFGVAAHLEPEILIVDEVLAVGDAEFQKKALGKMKDVSTNQGRTVLFVSHNMAAIKNLCSSAIHMEKGKVKATGDAEKVIGMYLDQDFKDNKLVCTEKLVHDNYIFEGAHVNYGPGELNNGCDLIFSFYFNFLSNEKYSAVIYFYREEDLAFCAMDAHEPLFMAAENVGKRRIDFLVPKYLLNPGRYSIHFALVDFNGNSNRYFYKENLLLFDLPDDNFRRGGRYNLGWKGAVSPILQSRMEVADTNEILLNTIQAIDKENF